MKKRVMSVLICLLMVLALFGCKKKEPKEEKKEPKKVEVVEEKEEIQEADPENMNNLTGLGTLSPEAIGKRPVAVMINNIEPALPQYGITQADVIFEIPVEGDNTRFMALYGDYTQVPQVCAVRSLRAYFASYAVGFDAFMVHWGMDDSMDHYFDALELERFDGISGVGGMFLRDQDRLSQGYALEHTGCFDGTKFPAYVQSTGKRLELKDNKKGPTFSFNPLNKVEDAGTQKINTASINFGAQSSSFTYDEATKTYKKLLNNKPQVDGKTNEQLAFTNVLVLETPISVRDEIGHKEVDWDGDSNAVGYYLSNGTMQKIHWHKEVNNEWSNLTFMDESNQKEVRINRGKTYIAVNYPGQATFEEK